MIPAVFLSVFAARSTLVNSPQTNTMSFLIPLRNHYSKLSSFSSPKLQNDHVINSKDHGIIVRNKKGNGPESPPLSFGSAETSDS